MQLPFRVTVCGLDELASHGAARVTHVLSILDPDWPVPDAFNAFGAHEKMELRFDDIIEPRRGMVMPAPGDVARLLGFGRRLDQARDGHLLVHCHAGVSRSSAAMALLIAQARPAAPAAAVFDEVLRIRPQIWPNLAIIEMGDEALGRDGALVKAVAGIYRRQLVRSPELADEFRTYGRAREVDAASQ